MQRTARRVGPAVASLVAALAATLLVPSAAHADRASLCANAEADAFDDVAPGSTHAANIDCIAAYDITIGVGGGNYDPSGYVRRGQMASFLVNFHEVATGTEIATPAPSSFVDIDGTTHDDNIRRAAQLAITEGRTPTTYAPQRYVTRGQMASFIVRALRAADVELDLSAPTRFTDVAGTTHERTINALADAGITRGVSADHYDPHGHVTREQMATFLVRAATLLASNGAWDAPPLPSDGPQLLLVMPSGAATDAIEVLWDRDVTTSAAGSDVEVADATDTHVVAGGDVVTTVAGDRTRITLDADLAPGDVYWVRIAGGIATGPEGKVNDEQRLAFVFAAAEGGDGPSSPTVPSVASVTTDPAGSRLTVVFDRPVTCPDTANGRAAWSFVNGSTVDVETHASGAPEQVVQTDGPSDTCHLGYTTAGIADGDFGTLAYTQPANAADQIRTAEGAPLASLASQDVVDSVAPVFESVIAHGGSAIVGAVFSEPIACSTVDASGLALAVEGTPVAIDEVSCADSASSTLIVTLADPLNDPPAVGETVTVSVLEGATFADHSRDNPVPAATRSATAAGA